MNKKLLTYTISTIYIILMLLGVMIESVYFCVIVCGLSSIGSLWLDYYMDKWREKPIKKEDIKPDIKIEHIQPQQPPITGKIYEGVLIPEEETHKSWFGEMSESLSVDIGKITELLKGEEDGTENE